MTEPMVESSIETVLDVGKAGMIRVLHVDDDPNFLKVAKQCLEMQGGFDVDIASSVDEALKKLKQRDYDVIVSDYQMPDKDGLEFLKGLREKGNTVPFIVFTGKGREEIAREALNLGADRYVDKHGDPEIVYCELAHSTRVAVERKKAIEALSAERDRLETVTRNIGAGLAIISRDYRTLWANDILKQAFGDVEGKICYSTYNHRNDVCPGCGVQEIFETGKAKAVHEQVGKDINGETVWSEITATPVKDSEGNITVALELVVPITERKKAEVALRESEERFRAIVESAPFGYYRVGKDGLWQYVNPVWERMHELSLEEVVGKPFEITQTEDSVEQAKEYVKRALAGEAISGEFSRLTGKGGIKYHSFNIQPVKHNNEIVAIEGFINDITERKKMEKALLESEAKWRSIAENSPHHIMLLDRDAKILYINHTVSDLANEEVLGKSMYDYVPSGFHKVVADCIESVLETGRQSSYITEYHTKRGEIRHFGVRVAPVFQSGKVVGLISNSTDITERVKMVDEIRNLARFPSENPNPVLRLNREGNILYANNPGKTLLQDWEHEVADRTPEFLRNVVAETISKQSEKSFDLKLGKQVYSITVTPVMGSDYANIYGADITERKQMEKTIRRSEEKFRNLFNNAKDAMMYLDNSGRILDANERAIEVFGGIKEEMVGKHFTKISVFSIKEIPKFMRNFADILAGKKVNLSVSIKNKKGQDIALECSASLVKTDEFAGIVVVARDISERKKAEEALKSSEQKFRGLIEDSAAAIATTDLKGRLTYVNKAFADLFGYSIQEMSDHAFKDFLHPDERGRVVRLFLKAIVLRRPLRKFEFRALQKDSAILHLVCKPTRIEFAGKTVGFQAIIMDNTAEKEMLEKVEKINEKLSVVGGLTRHDVRNKLSVILNASYLLGHKLRDNQQNLELVRETESAVHQIESLFEFARIYEKLGTEKLTYVDAERIFKEATMLFPNLHDINIVNDCHGLTVFADSLLRQLFYNLIDNSLKHGKKVSQIRVHYQTDKDHLKLIYEDDGIGIPKAEKDKIFREDHGKGTGHGLHLIKKICEAYGWTILETGEQGKGVQFTISIPRTDHTGKPNH